MRRTGTKRIADLRGKRRELVQVDATTDEESEVRSSVLLRGQVGGQALRNDPSTLVESARDIGHLQQRYHPSAQTEGDAAVVCVEKHPRIEPCDAGHQRLHLQRECREVVQESILDPKKNNEDWHVVSSHLQTMQA